LRSAAIEAGCPTLLQEGFLLARSGLTTLTEIQRAIAATPLETRLDPLPSPSYSESQPLSFPSEAPQTQKESIQPQAQIETPAAVDLEQPNFSPAATPNSGIFCVSPPPALSVGVSQATASLQAQTRDYWRRQTKQEVLQSFIDVIEAFERANQQFANTESSPLQQGYQQIYRLFVNALRKVGVAEISAQIGDPVVPNFHEVVATIPTQTHPPGVVLHQICQGYALDGVILTPAQVVIAVSEPEDAS
jgi:hypothetical protein